MIIITKGFINKFFSCFECKYHPSLSMNLIIKHRIWSEANQSNKKLQKWTFTPWIFRCLQMYLFIRYANFTDLCLLIFFDGTDYILCNYLHFYWSESRWCKSELIFISNLNLHWLRLFNRNSYCSLSILFVVDFVRKT